MVRDQNAGNQNAAWLGSSHYCTSESFFLAEANELPAQFGEFGTPFVLGGGPNNPTS